MNQRNIKSFGDNNEVLVGQLTEDAGVYVVTLNSPETINALSGGMVRAIADAFNGISALAKDDPNEDDVRAVILKSAGQGFVIGIDIGRLDEYFSGGMDDASDPWKAIWDCPFPVIGAINGPAVTGGFEIATACDILLASPTAIFQDNHPKYGVHPGKGLSQRLIHVCGVNNAKLATLASFPIDAELAMTWGLVQQVYPDRESLEQGAVKIAKMISNNHPVMVKRYKKLIEGGVSTTYAEGLKLEAESESTFYDSLTDLEATLADGTQKFNKVFAEAKARETS